MNTLWVNIGKLTAHRNLRIGMLSQHHIDVMSDQLDINLLQYIQTRSVVMGLKDLSDFEGRAHLGKFGLSGQVVLQVRLALAITCLTGEKFILDHNIITYIKVRIETEIIYLRWRIYPEFELAARPQSASNEGKTSFL